MAQSDQEHHQSVRHYLHIAWRRRWALLVCVVGIPLITYVVTSGLAKNYQASTIIQPQPAVSETALFTNQVTSSATQIANVARLIQTTGVAAQAAKHFSAPRPSPGALLSKIQVISDDNAGFVTIRAHDSPPQRAAEIANSFAAAIGTTRARSSASQINKTIGT